MVIELEQSFQPLRSASWGDMAANATGVLCGMVAILVWRGRQNAKLKKATVLT
ncbi:hypothetical protein D3C80_2140030 [compost metagenome]